MRISTASFAMLAALFVSATASAALSPRTDVIMTADAWRYDGSWNVVVFCPASGNAPASAMRFNAGIRDGVLHGERGASGSRGSMTLDGTIQPDGLAHLHATGVTNDADEVLGVSPRDTAFVYEVAARFQGSHGLGARIEGGTCHITFTRE